MTAVVAAATLPRLCQRVMERVDASAKTLTTDAAVVRMCGTSAVVVVSLAQPHTDAFDVVIILLALIVAEFRLAGPGIRVVVAVGRARPTINAESAAITPHVWTA